MIADRS